MSNFVDICNSSCRRFVGVVLSERVWSMCGNVGGSFFFFFFFFFLLLIGCNNFLVLATTKENLVTACTNLFQVSPSASGMNVNVSTFHPWLAWIELEMAASLLATSVFATRQHINIFFFFASLCFRIPDSLPPTRKCVGVCCCGEASNLQTSPHMM